MPRTGRASAGGVCYHVLNRGNGRQQVFFKDGDYAAFVQAMADACTHVPMRVLAYCLMPNHFHLVLWPTADGDLSTWMHWMSNAHVRRYRQHYKGSGHVWQGRFKAFPVQTGEYLLTLIRYVERNPLRAGLVLAAERWLWSSVRSRLGLVLRPEWLVDGPLHLPSDYVTWLNEPATAAEAERIRKSVERGTPYGAEEWQERIAHQLGLESTLRPRGRPKKER